MESRCESIFSTHSYGYRPGRNAHQALEAVIAANRHYDWVIDLDISKFFDEIDHELLRMSRGFYTAGKDGERHRAVLSVHYLPTCFYTMP